MLPNWTPRLVGLCHENKILYVQIKGMTWNRLPLWFLLLYYHKQHKVTNADIRYLSWDSSNKLYTEVSITEYILVGNINSSGVCAPNNDTELSIRQRNTLTRYFSSNEHTKIFLTSLRAAQIHYTLDTDSCKKTECHTHNTSNQVSKENKRRHPEIIKSYQLLQELCWLTSCLPHSDRISSIQTHT